MKKNIYTVIASEAKQSNKRTGSFLRLRPGMTMLLLVTFYLLLTSVSFAQDSTKVTDFTEDTTPASAGIFYYIESSTDKYITWNTIVDAMRDSLNINRIASVSSNYTIPDTIDVVFVTTGATNDTLTLPVTSIGNGRTYKVKKVDNGAGTVILIVEGAGTIDGDPSYSIFYQYTAYSFIKNGSNYLVY